MDIKKLILGTISGAIVFSLLNWLVYSHLLKSYMAIHSGSIPHIGRPEYLMLYTAVANLFYGALLSFIFVKANIRSVVSGFITGAGVGFLLKAAIGFMMYARTLVTSKHAILGDSIAFALICGITGVILAVIIGGGKKE